MVKQLIRTLLASPPVLPHLRRRLAHDCVTVLMYHELAVDDAAVEAWTVVRRSAFLRQVEYLRRHYEIVSLDDALRRVDAEEASERPLAVLTFDDGDYGNFEILLPLAESLALPVTIFIATGQVLDQRVYWFDRVVNALQGDRPVILDLRREGLKRYVINKRKGPGNWEDIQRLLTDIKETAPDRRDEITDQIVAAVNHAGGAYQVQPLAVEDVRALARSPWVTIGAHSHCHNLLTQVRLDEAERSVVRSRELLACWTTRPVRHFAYPNGSYNDDLMRLIERLGFASGLSTGDALWRRGCARFCIPRIAVGRYDSMEAFRLNLVGGPKAAVRQLVASGSKRGG